MLTLADALEALANVRPETAAGAVITEAAVDSRQVIPGSLFVAIPGENADGHDFVAEAFRKGASFALIHRDVQGDFPVLDLRYPLDPEALRRLSVPFCLRVENTLSALQQIARFWRRRLSLRVIGITGSVGKSTTKEVVAQVLNQRYRTLKSPGNLNNEIGLPLTILRLTTGYERAVLEMGFYVPGEIAFLSDIAQPQIGVVTNIGTVHAERAGSQENIFLGKSELVQSLPAAPEGVAILNFDDPWVRKMEEKTHARVFFYGLSPEAVARHPGIRNLVTPWISVREVAPSDGTSRSRELDHGHDYEPAYVEQCHSNQAVDTAFGCTRRQVAHHQPRGHVHIREIHRAAPLHAAPWLIHQCAPWRRFLRLRAGTRLSVMVLMVSFIEVDGI